MFAVSPSLTILVPSWFVIISVVFLYVSKLLFSGFLQFKGNFVRGQNNSNTGTEFLSELRIPKKQRSEEQGEIFVEAALGGISWQLQRSLKSRFCGCTLNTLTENTCSN